MEENKLWTIVINRKQPPRLTVCYFVHVPCGIEFYSKLAPSFTIDMCSKCVVEFSFRLHQSICKDYLLLRGNSCGANIFTTRNDGLYERFVKSYIQIFHVYVIYISNSACDIAWSKYFEIFLSYFCPVIPHEKCKCHISCS